MLDKIDGALFDAKKIIRYSTDFISDFNAGYNIGFKEGITRIKLLVQKTFEHLHTSKQQLFNDLNYKSKP